MTSAQLNGLLFDAAVDGLSACCGSQRWARRVAEQRPFATVDALRAAVDGAFASLGADDWLEAFAAHPRIGEQASAQSSSAAWSQQEQRGVQDADSAVRAALAQGNRDYLERFGFIFLICATGKSAADMLAQLQDRLSHTRAEELACAAREQQKITHLRLDKWVQA